MYVPVTVKKCMLLAVTVNVRYSCCEECMALLPNRMYDIVTKNFFFTLPVKNVHYCCCKEHANITAEENVCYF